MKNFLNVLWHKPTLILTSPMTRDRISPFRSDTTDRNFVIDPIARLFARFFGGIQRLSKGRRASDVLQENLFGHRPN
jgi:hypothetical protein